MSALILEGRPVAERIRNELTPAINQFRKSYGIAPTLAVVRVGNPAAAVSYALAIDRAFTESAMGFQMNVLPEDCSTDRLISRLNELSRTHDVHGILLQRPTPGTIDLRLAVQVIPPLKDVEGVTPANFGNLSLDTGDFYSTSTPSAAIELLAHYGIAVQGKHALVVGRSDNVGKPMAALLIRANATVIVAHSHTPDLACLARQADLVFVAAGKPGLVNSEMIKEGAIVVDFGVNVKEGKLVGDVDFEPVKQIAAAVTPVPGGTGPVTTMLLMRNTLLAAERQIKQPEIKSRIKWLPILKSPNRRK